MRSAAQATRTASDRSLPPPARASARPGVHPHTYDLAVLLAGGIRTYPLAEGDAIVLKALAPLGQNYVDRLSEAFHAKRMHATAAPGKAPGASTDPADDSMMPFVLVTYTGEADSVSALAHEWGHAMHMKLSRAAQPFETADFSYFIADTPSLLNEMLLDDYMVEHAANRDERIAALSEAVEVLRYTYYRVLPMMRMEMAERAVADKGSFSWKCRTFRSKYLSRYRLRTSSAFAFGTRRRLGIPRRRRSSRPLWPCSSSRFRQRRNCRELMPINSAACHHLIFPAEALNSTSCNFIARSAAVLG